MNLVSMLNHLAGPWTAWMRFALFDGTFALGSAGLVWLVARRRASCQFGYLLFLLALVPLAVPLPFDVPAPLAWLSPRYAAGQSVTWLERLAVGRSETTAGQHRNDSLEKTSVERSTHEARRTTGHADLLPRVASAGRTVDETPPTLSKQALLMLGWATTVVTLIARFAWVQSDMARRLKIARRLDPKSLPFDFAELRGRMGLRREVRLATSEIVASPAVWGLWRPRLVLPPGLVEQLPRGQLAWVLSHELAHVRRGDLVVVLLQKLVQIVYFFHPAVWLANRLIDRQRECACDDAALAAAGCAGRECGAALVAVVERACGVPPIPALGLFHSQAFLRRRTTRLVDCQGTAPRRLSWASVGCLGLLAVIVLPRVSATEVPNPKKPVATSQDDLVDDERSSDTVALVDDPPDGPSDDANDGSDVQRSDVVLAERKAAIQAMRKTGGGVYPDFEKLAASGERDYLDPKHDFVGASFFRVGKLDDDTLALLAHLPEIERVDLIETEISDAALERLAPLHKLRRLGLDKSTISDNGLAHVGQFRELRVLRLSNTGMTDVGLAHVAVLRRLESLTLDNTAISGDGLTHLKGIRNLQEVSLQGTNLDDDGLAYLARLPKLRELNLNGTKIGDNGVSHLRNTTSLEAIHLRGTRLTDEGLAHLAGLNGLRILESNGTRVGDAGFERLAALNKLTSLSLGDTQIGDRSAALIGRFEDLLDLDLSATNITDAGVAQLARLTKLTSLKLSGTKIGDGALAHLADCDKLEELYLAETAVSDAGLAHLKPLVALRFLDLSGTQIADPRLEPRKALPALAKLNVERTTVSQFDKLRSLPQTSPNVQKILAALDEKTELDFTDQPLSDVIDYLKNRHEIEIWFDRKSFDKQGIKVFAPITARLEGVTLRKGLEAILDPLNLTIGIRHEVLMMAAKPLPGTVLDLPGVPAGQRLSPKLAAALVQRSELDFTDQPLSDVVDYLKARHDIQIRLDNDALAKAGIGSDTPITRNLKGITLKSVLELILGDLDLTCAAEGDALVIRPQKAK